MASERDTTIENLSGIFPPDRNGNARFSLLLYNLFSADECQKLIAKSEAVGYKGALVNVGGGRQTQMLDYRNSGRCIIFDPSFAEVLYQRILTGLKGTEHEDLLLRAPWIPAWKVQNLAVGCNERLSFLRYDPGHYFKPHFDGMYRRSEGPRRGEKSFVTVQLYLNEGFRGGATTFFSTATEERLRKVVPRMGSVLLFEHNLLHEGSELLEGRKYAMRTDIMYTMKGPGHEYSNDTTGLSYDESAETNVPSRPSRPRRRAESTDNNAPKRQNNSKTA